MRAATVTALRAAAIAQSARSVAAGREVVGSDGVVEEGGSSLFEAGFLGDLRARWLIVIPFC
ncbi:MAG TPA: hypothetical protein VIS06_09115 [Mycobacteriales bacterium]